MRKFLVLGIALAALMATTSPAAANFRCDGTFTGIAVDGDLVVPPGATCNVTGATVEDDIELLATGILVATDTTVGEDVQIHRDAVGELNNSDVGDSVYGRTADTVFIHNGSTVGGGIRTFSTLNVFVFSSTVAEQISVRDTPAELSGRVNICGSTAGRIHVADSGTDILIGDPNPLVECAGNIVQTGDLEVEENFVDVELAIGANTVLVGDLEVSNNTGPAEKPILNNTGSAELECTGNEQPFLATGNTGWAEFEGQCEPGV
jgi:hypothetical protein